MPGTAIRAVGRADRPQVHPVGCHDVQVVGRTRREMSGDRGERRVVVLAGVDRAADRLRQVPGEVVQKEPIADRLRRRHVGAGAGAAHDEREGIARTRLQPQPVTGHGIGHDRQGLVERVAGRGEEPGSRRRLLPWRRPGARGGREQDRSRGSSDEQGGGQPGKKPAGARSPAGR